MFVLTLVCLIIPLSVTSKECPISLVRASESQLQKLQATRMEIALDWLRSVASKDPSQNVLLSPDSIYTAFQLLYFASSNRSEQILRRFLHIPDGMDKNTIVGAYIWERGYYRIQSVKLKKAFEVDSANRIYVQQGRKMRSCVKNFFSDDIAWVNFGNQSELSVKNINEWVKKVTKNMITDLLPQGYLKDTTAMVLVNAVYFRGFWENRFLKRRTNQEKFYLSDGSTKSVDMMHAINKFKVVSSNDLGVKGIELPYKGDVISMFIIMPHQSNSSAISELLSSLAPERLQAIIFKILGRPLKMYHVAIPKFKIEKDFDLIPIIKEMGAEELLRSADLSDFLESSNGLKVDKALHAAKIKVDEKGTKAAAATAIVGGKYSRIPQFRGNRPFLYVIYSKATNSLLFTGILNSP